MSSFNAPTRRLFLLASLAACGFQPVLANKKISALWGKVELPVANDDSSFTARQTLAKYFGEANDPLYRLEFVYSVAASELAVTQSSVVSRYRLAATGFFRAYDIGNNQLILNQPYNRFASYSTNSDSFASDQARASRETALVESLADDFAIRFIDAVSQKSSINK